MRLLCVRSAARSACHGRISKTVFPSLSALPIVAAMEALETRILPVNDESLVEATDLLSRGELVAFATETVYGLGADATNDTAVARIFEVKERPSFNPLICHFPSGAAAAGKVHFDERARSLAAAFWPGPLTLVLSRLHACRVSLLCSAGLDTLAVRVPAQESARRLLTLLGRPIAAPSANRSGNISPTAAAHVAEELNGRIGLILDDGPCPVGLESTVVDLSSEVARLLRPGGVPTSEIEALIGPLEKPEERGPLLSPGQLVSHYAPRHPLRLDASTVSGEEALLAFGAEPLAGAKMMLNLSPGGDPVEAAANLYAFLRALDSMDVEAIAAMPIPEQGLGRAINDRLRRAAAPRQDDASAEAGETAARRLGSLL